MTAPYMQIIKAIYGKGVKLPHPDRLAMHPRTFTVIVADPAYYRDGNHLPTSYDEPHKINGVTTTVDRSIEWPVVVFFQRCPDCNFSPGIIRPVPVDARRWSTGPHAGKCAKCDGSRYLEYHRITLEGVE